MQVPIESAQLLAGWYRLHKRPLPWRETGDPYRIWLSEIMCQQTRVEAVIPYYHRFLKELPDIPALAACPEEKLLKLWEGLGYYSRARNLQKAADLICRSGGSFPTDYPTVRALPGIGDYTAAAVCSIAYGLPYPAVDGNVLRVITRLTGSEADIMKPDTRKTIREALQPLFREEEPGLLNQAMMELGALICRPNAAPLCGECPLRSLCMASKEERWKTIPVKSRKPERRIEELTVLILRCGERVALRQRKRAGLLAGLWELPNVPGTLTATEAMQAAEKLGCSPQRPLMQKEAKHVFTHVTWNMRAYTLLCSEASEGLIWADAEALRREYSLPTAFRQFLTNIIEENKETSK